MPATRTRRCPRPAVRATGGPARDHRPPWELAPWALATGDRAAGYWAPRAAPAAAEALSSGPGASWRLDLSAGARRLVGLMLLLGLLTAAGAGAWAGAAVNAARTRAREISQLDAGVARFNTAVAAHDAAAGREQRADARVVKAQEALQNADDAFDRALERSVADDNNCSTVSCFGLTAVPVARAGAAFGRVLRATSVPPGAAAIAQRLMRDNTEYEYDWREQALAGTWDSSIAYADDAETAGKGWDTDFAALTKSLQDENTALGVQAVTLNDQATALNQQGAELSRLAAARNATVRVRTAATGY